MKKNIIIVALLSVITGSMYGEPVSGYRERPRRYPHKEPVQTQASVQIQDTAPVQQGRTWGQWWNEKTQSVNQAVNPYQSRNIAFKEPSKPKSVIENRVIEKPQAKWYDRFDPLGAIIRHLEYAQQEIYNRDYDEYNQTKKDVEDNPIKYGFSGINPYITRARINPETEMMETQKFELPVRGIVATGAIAGGAYLAGRWAWNRFMTPEFKKIENKINHATKANEELITQITNALNNSKATADDKAVLRIYADATKKCQDIYAGMKNDVEQHRKNGPKK